MYEMILYLVNKKRVLTLRELERFTGLKKNEILKVLNILMLKGKINYLNINNITFHSCSNCSLKKNFKKRGGTNGIIFK